MYLQVNNKEIANTKINNNYPKFKYVFPSYRENMSSFIHKQLEDN